MTTRIQEQDTTSDHDDNNNSDTISNNNYNYHYNYNPNAHVIAIHSSTSEDENHATDLNMKAGGSGISRSSRFAHRSKNEKEYHGDDDDRSGVGDDDLSDTTPPQHQWLLSSRATGLSRSSSLSPSPTPSSSSSLVVNTTTAWRRSSYVSRRRRSRPWSFSIGNANRSNKKHFNNNNNNRSSVVSNHQLNCSSQSGSSNARASSNNKGSHNNHSTTIIQRQHHHHQHHQHDDGDFVPPFIGIFSPWAVLWGCIFLMVPLAYLYIAWTLLMRIETCRHVLSAWLPPSWIPTSTAINNHNNSSSTSWNASSWLEIWCWIEGVFYLGSKIHIHWLQCFDPLEASLSAAPLMDMTQRELLWQRMLAAERASPVTFLTGWFFWDQPITTATSSSSTTTTTTRTAIHTIPALDTKTATKTTEGTSELLPGDSKTMLPNTAGTNTAEYSALSSSSRPALLSSCAYQLALLQQMSRYDVRDFIAWSMFEGRHQEHLTADEVKQLESFVCTLEQCISRYLYGNKDDSHVGRTDSDDKVADPLNDESITDEYIDPNDHDNIHDQDGNPASSNAQSHQMHDASKKRRQRKEFRFPETHHEDESNFFSRLYETYRARYEQIMSSSSLNSSNFHPVQDLKELVLSRATASLPEFHPVQDLRQLLTETASQLAEAETRAMATASHVYETLVPTGSPMNKQLMAMSRATYLQMTEAWDSVKNIKERLETAEFISQQRAKIEQQLRGYEAMLHRVRDMSSAIPSKQMAALMRRITDCYEAMERMEHRAQNAFVRATGYARTNLPQFLQQPVGAYRGEPRTFAMYSSDPLMGIATYPLGFHLLVLSCTEIPLRIMMRRRGFVRHTEGPVTYYHHPGRCNNNNNVTSKRSKSLTPVVFVHGIGIGLIVYMPLIDAMLETGRPVLLPEIPYVSGFRPWQSPHAVLSPAVVASSMSAMLINHGYLYAHWLGHSYGTSWLSYMCQFAPDAVVSLTFLDPICFCLHVPRLTKQFVYTKPDPGTISYMVRTDVIVHWTIQRSFPWAWIILFEEQIHVPTLIFLSEHDALVPAGKVESYLRSKNVSVTDFDCDHDTHVVVKATTRTVIEDGRVSPTMTTSDTKVLVMGNSGADRHSKKKEKYMKNRTNKELGNNKKKDKDGKEDSLQPSLSASSSCSFSPDSKDRTCFSENTSTGPPQSQEAAYSPPPPTLEQQQEQQQPAPLCHPLISCTVFRGDGHGGWTERPGATVPKIAAAIEVLCQRADAFRSIADDPATR